MNAALIVGVNEVDAGRYGRPMPTLRSAERDAMAMAHFLRNEKRFDTGTPMLGRMATLDAVIAQLQWAARRLVNPNDVFVMYFAGHGSQVPDPTWSERDGKNETFCLYDGELIDHALYVALAAFRPKVKVLVVTDCCHSGADELWESPRKPLPREVAARTLPRELALDAYRSLAFSCNMQPRLRPGERQRILSADVELLAACRESELAFEGPELGYFTDALLQVWARHKELPFAELESRVDLKTPNCQTPNCAPLSRPGRFTHMPF